MVLPERLERSTLRLEIWCSILLSYGSKKWCALENSNPYRWFRRPICFPLHQRHIKQTGLFGFLAWIFYCCSQSKNGAYNQIWADNLPFTKRTFSQLNYVGEKWRDGWDSNSQIVVLQTTAWPFSFHPKNGTPTMICTLIPGFGDQSPAVERSV